MRKLISLLVVFVMVLSFAFISFAASNEAVDAADILHELGLFNGVGSNPDGTPNYDLDREPTREEAVTMLIRLLGKEEEANATEWDVPFNDVASWAKPYVGYAYTNGLTSGTSATTFSGNSTVSATQYITFVLRALGYSSETDFKWNEAWLLSDKIGITNGQYCKDIAFTRGDTALVSKNSLSAKIKGSDETLIESLEIEMSEENIKDEISLVAPPIADKSINQYLLSLKPDECREVGAKDGTLWHLYWFGKDLTPEINKYMRGLSGYKGIGTLKPENTTMSGSFTRVEILDDPQIETCYAVQWINESKMTNDEYWPQPEEEDVKIGDSYINEELFKFSPDRCRENNSIELNNKFYTLIWYDGNEGLYRDICLIFKDYPNYSDGGEDIIDSDVEIKMVSVEILERDKVEEVYSYHVNIFNGDGKMRHMEFWKER